MKCRIFIGGNLIHNKQNITHFQHNLWDKKDDNDIVYIYMNVYDNLLPIW